MAVAFHSGRAEPDYEKITWDESSNNTTQFAEVQNQKDRATRMGKHLIIFSTYHSCHKLIGMPVHTMIADESQYCVTEGFFDSVKDLTAARKLFFTATEKHSAIAGGRGLNNEEFFGPIIYQIDPKTLIERNIIVQPCLHFMHAASGDTEKTAVDEVISITEHQAKTTLQTLPVCKVLFAMRGTKDVVKVIERIQDIKTRLPDFTVFTIVSNGKFGAMIDGVKVSRGALVKTLRETNKAIICHFDILSEGIDIDGITGVAVLRKLNHSKLLQTIGRAVRIYKADPKAKTSALVSVPVINGDAENELFVSNVVKMIRDGGYDVNREIISHSDFGLGIADPYALDNAYSMDSRRAAMKLLENIIHEQELAAELERFWSMTEEERILEVY